MYKQPKALYLLNFVSMWECFSYYGMRVLLVLYMVHELRYSDEQAFGMYALYTTLVELGGIVGGVVADRYLGLKRSIVLGGITILLGHVAMSMSQFFIGLLLIVLGTALFRSNVAAFLGHFYEEDDPRREAGYTLYYTGINFGGFLATIGCAVVGELYGWHAGFGLAGVGMFCGLIALFLGRKLLEPKTVSTSPMSWKKIREIKHIAYFLLFLVLFYMCEEQLGSSLVLFGERHVNRETLFGTIPAASLITFNPLTILLLGPFISKIALQAASKISIGFLLLAASFGVLYFGACATGMHLGYAVAGIVLLSCGELLIGPTVFALASRAVPKSYSGLAMGIVSLGYALANFSSGLLSQIMSVSEQDVSLVVYTKGFLLITLFAFCISLVVRFCFPKSAGDTAPSFRT